LLVGRRQARVVTILEAVETANLAAAGAPDRFEIDPRVHLRLQRDLRGSDRQIVGLFHSHPQGAAQPSAIDRAEAAYAGWVWLITAIVDDACETRGYVDTGAAFLPLRLEVCST
ncbi:MAG: M67 family metallopeptidase, partial [Rhodothalassiaceae bacterium]